MMQPETSELKSHAHPSIHVMIVSDFVCPWCWLGLQFFLTAAQQNPQRIRLSWHPFMLDPSIPAKGLPYKDYIAHKFTGSKAQTIQQVQPQLEAAALQAGIKFNFKDIPLRPNTLSAHQVMHWASGQNCATGMAKRLFKAFFQDLLDIGNHDTLASLAREIGLDGNIVADLLERGADQQTVKDAIQNIRQRGIHSVPTFIYQEKYVIQGAQPSAKHLAMMQQCAEQTRDNAS